jgi:hypothetical protein
VLDDKRAAVQIEATRASATRCRAGRFFTRGCSCEIAFRANRRLLEVERLSYDCILAEQTFQRINGPVEHAGQRASGLRFADPRIHALGHALILFRLLPKGFRRTDLRNPS